MPQNEHAPSPEKALKQVPRQVSASAAQVQPVPILRRPMSPHDVLQLQQTVGNQAIGRILDSNIQRQAIQVTASKHILVIQRSKVCDDEGVCRSEPDVEPTSSQQNYVEALPSEQEQAYGPPPPPEQNYSPAPPPEQAYTPGPPSEQPDQPAPPLIDPDAQRIANVIEENGGECYDVSKVSYSELLAKLNELLRARQPKEVGKLPEIREARPDEIIESRSIYYLDDTSGIPRVRSRMVQGTKAQLDELEYAEQQKIGQSQLSGLGAAAGGLGGQIPSPGQSWKAPENAQGTRPPYYQEPP